MNKNRNNRNTNDNKFQNQENNTPNLTCEMTPEDELKPPRRPFRAKIMSDDSTDSESDLEADMALFGKHKSMNRFKSRRKMAVKDPDPSDSDEEIIEWTTSEQKSGASKTSTQLEILSDSSTDSQPITRKNGRQSNRQRNKRTPISSDEDYKNKRHRKRRNKNKSKKQKQDPEYQKRLERVEQMRQKRLQLMRKASEMESDSQSQLSQEDNRESDFQHFNQDSHAVGLIDADICLISEDDFNEQSLKSTISKQQQMQHSAGSKTVHAAQESEERNREKIVIKIKDKNQKTKKYKVFKDDPLEITFRHYCVNALKKDRKTVKFMFDGLIVQDSQTPNDLDCEDDDIIDARCS
mmetsp:Transcript_9117/g.12084  ORF Transcript_9117/g.12084 Transcript_9117/m.12084 type:complete len:351 (-) Transcript_9117:133-1185(-)